MQKRLEEKVELSIILVNWNAKEFLINCLHSIYSTIYEMSYEIIVADNESNDGSQEMIRETFPLVKLICSGNNLGFAKANNLCIKQSRGQYICLINPDVIVHGDSLNLMVGYMNGHPDVGMLGPKVLNPDLTLQKKNYKRLPTYWNTLCRATSLDTLFPTSRLFGSTFYSAELADSPCDIEVLAGCFWLIRRSALNKVGLLDELFFMYDEDTDWCKRFWDAGWKVRYFPNASIIHYGGGSSSNIPIQSYIILRRSSLLYWKKHHGLLGYYYMFLIIFLHEIIRIIGSSILIPIKSSERNILRYKISKSFYCILWLIKTPGLKLGKTG